MVKTTLDLDDALLLRAKKLSRRTGQPLRALVEEGLRRVLEPKPPSGSTYVLPDCSVGTPGAPNPIEALSWPELRDEIYGTPRR
jgi:hypothetical protein